MHRNTFRRQLGRLAERDLPANLAASEVHGVQLPPRRLLARQAVRVPEPRVVAPRTRPPIRERRAGRLRRIKGSDFEVVTPPPGYVAPPIPTEPEQRVA